MLPSIRLQQFTHFSLLQHVGVVCCSREYSESFRGCRCLFQGSPVMNGLRVECTKCTTRLSFPTCVLKRSHVRREYCGCARCAFFIRLDPAVSEYPEHKRLPFRAHVGSKGRIAEAKRLSLWKGRLSLFIVGCAVSHLAG